MAHNKINNSNRPHVLKVGSRGAAVKRLEVALKKEGLLKGKVDNFFSAKTKAAVRKWEDKHGWSEAGRKEDGIVGGLIWKKLNLSGAAHTASVGDVNTSTGQGTVGQTGQSSQAATGNGGSSTFKTVTVNVKSNPVMPQSAVVHDVRQAAKSGDIIGWNEIGPARYKKAIKDLGPGWGHYMPKGIPNPISWKKSKFKLLDAGTTKTHNGLAKVSPHRYVTWVKLQDKKTGETFVRMNTHLVSGAFSGKSHHAYRIKSWHKHIAVMNRMIAKFERQGQPVIIGGDFNRDSFKLFGNRVKYDNKLNVGTHGRSTLDYLMHTGNELRARGVKVDKNYRSDHNGVTVTYTLKG